MSSTTPSGGAGARRAPSGDAAGATFTEASRLRHLYFSKLQAAAVAFGEAIPIPEIVCVGGQSDGKSSLLEGARGGGGGGGLSLRLHIPPGRPLLHTSPPWPRRVGAPPR